MKRFKTEEEFINEYGDGWRIQVKWHNTKELMDYLFGCVYSNSDVCIDQEYASKLGSRYNQWYLTEDMLTDKRHPYSTGKWYIKVPEGKHDKVQAKALACGFGWALAREGWFDSFKAYRALYIRYGEMYAGNGEQDGYTELTYEQFMNGNMIDQDKWLKVMYFNSDLDYMVFVDANGELQKFEIISSNLDWMITLGYKLVTKEEFDKLTNQPIKFKGYDVEILNDNINISCKSINKKSLKSFRMIAEMIIRNFSSFDINDMKEAIRLIDKIYN